MKKICVFVLVVAMMFTLAACGGGGSGNQGGGSDVRSGNSNYKEYEKVLNKLFKGFAAEDVGAVLALFPPQAEEWALTQQSALSEIETDMKKTPVGEISKIDYEIINVEAMSEEDIALVSDFLASKQIDSSLADGVSIPAIQKGVKLDVELEIFGENGRVALMGETGSERMEYKILKYLIYNSETDTYEPPEDHLFQVIDYFYHCSLIMMNGEWYLDFSGEELFSLFGEIWEIVQSTITDHSKWTDNEFTRMIPELKGDNLWWSDTMVDDDFAAGVACTKEYYLAYIEEMMAMGWYATTHDGDKGEGSFWKAHNDSTGRDIEVSFASGNAIPVMGVNFPKEK
jgi:hypothetical protein